MPGVRRQRRVGKTSIGASSGRNSLAAAKESPNQERVHWRTSYDSTSPSTGTLAGADF